MFLRLDAVSVDSCGNRRLIGRQLRVDSCGRSGAAVEIGLGGRGMKPFRAFEHVCQSLHVCTLYMAGVRNFFSFCR